MSPPAVDRSVFDLLASSFVARHPNEAARVFETATPGDQERVLRSQPPAVLGEVLRRLNPDTLARLLRQLDDARVPEVVPVLDPVRAAVALARLGDEDRKRILALLPAHLTREIESISGFPKGTAGRLMDSRFLTFDGETSVGTAMRRLQEVQDRRIADLMITDHDGKLTGLVRLQDLVSAPPEALLDAIKNTEVVAVSPLATQGEVTELLNEHRLASLPVIDTMGRALGIIRHAELVTAAQKSVVQDLQRMAGGSRDESALSPIRFAVRSRLPWLNINLVTAFMAASVVGIFESTISRFTALAVLLPVVAGQSGNTGAQALAVTMRSLALREIRTVHLFRVLRKELAVGFLNGLAIGLVTAIGVWVWSRSLGLAGIMFAAMIFSMIAAGAAGAAIPVALVRFGRDPAVASSIILTTVTDIVGFFSFLGLATLLAHLLVGLE